MIHLMVAHTPDHLIAPDGATNDLFGSAIGISETRLMVGAPSHSADQYLGGAAYAFEFDGFAWQMNQKINPPSPDAYGEFGCAIDIDGDTAAVGWMGAMEGDDRIGKVAIYTWANGIWKLHQLIHDPIAEHGDRFGVSVDLDDDHLIIGCQLDDEVASNAGSALIYQRSDDVWTFQSRLLPSQADAGSWAGRDVKIDGDLAVIGAYKEWNGDLQSAGAAYVFRHHPETGWSEETRLVASDAHAGDYFGFSVSVNQGRIAVGSILNDAPHEDSGAVYLFEIKDSQWHQQKIPPPDVGGEFGYGIELQGPDLYVGSVYHPGPGFATGAVYRFEILNDQSHWKGKWLPKAGADDCFYGASIVKDSGLVCIGSPREDTNGSWSGAAYIHLSSHLCEADLNDDVRIDVNDLLILISDWGSCESCDADINDDGQVGTDDLLHVLERWGWCQ